MPTRPFRKLSGFILGLAALVLIAQSSATAQGICDRTSQVRDKLLEITGVSECGDVTSTHLEEVTELNLTGAGITALQEGDFSGLTNLNELELSENSLTTLPEKVFSGLTNLEYLWLDNNSTLTSLTAGIFSGLTNLKWLELFDNSITSLPVGIFSGLTNLTDLSLGGNSLSTLPEDIFSGLGNLDWLNLYDNSLTSLPEEIFSGLSKLRILNLFKNSLTTLPEDLFSGLGNLKQLSLYDNDLTQLPATVFSGLDALELLRLNGNRFNNLPAGIFDDILDTLGSNTSGNGLSVDSSLKATLSFASTAQTASEGAAVQVSATLSRSLPVAVRVPFTIGGSASDDDYEDLSPAADSGLLFLAGETSKEITFTLSENNDNQVEALVLTLAQLSGIGLRRSDGTGADAPHLKTESLLSRSAASSTHTVTIPKPAGGICNRTAEVRDKLLELTGVTGCGNVASTHLEGVTSLIVSQSSISSLKAGDFSGLTQLINLKLDNNSLTSLPVGIFNGLSNLQELDLRSNSLSAVPAGIFSSLSALQFLSLTNNRLRTLPAGIFSGLSNLIRVGLSSNSLTSLPASIFSGLSNLQTLYLGSNSLTSLPASIFSGLGNLERLHFSGNPLTSIPVTVFNGLDSLENLQMGAISLTSLPAGIFDDILDTLGADSSVVGLSMDPSLKATLSFASTAQTASEGAAVQVSATLSRSLPVAVRVPFTIGGSASDDDYEELSPAADSGLLFLAGETSKEITFTLSENNDDREETLVLTLAQLSGIGLRRSDGTGADAPYLQTHRLLNRSATSSTHTVTIPIPSGGICDRTSEVRDKLLELTGVSGCANVTSTHLEGVTSLDLSNSSISALRAGDFSGLTQLTRLKLDDNSLTGLPAGIFSGLNSLQELDLRSNSLSALPPGIFDDILDTLGGNSGVDGLYLDSSLKATLSFASTAQTASEGAAVQVSATLSRALPVAVRVPFTIGGSADDGDYEGLSPAADSGLLFLAGETSKEIAFTLSENDDNREETLVLTLAQLSGIGLRRSDGSGSDAPHLETEGVLSRSATSSEHTVTIPKASGGICDRTSEVRDKLLELTGVSGCANVTSTHLEGVTSLDLSNSSISSLQAGDFGGLTQLTRLKLDNNSLTTLPAGIFSGLSRLQELDLRSNSLSSLSSGIFDDLLDTLGGNPGVDGLYLDSSLKATLGFASTAQTASEGAAVQLSATLSRALPVAVRVPFTIGGSAADDDYEGLSPAGDSGLLFLAGETSKEIGFTLSENRDNQEETLVLTLAELSGIGLRRSDGTGADAPHLETHRLLIRSAASATHTVTIPRYTEGICDRTAQVRDELLEVTGVELCADVSEDHLAEVTELKLSASGIASLQPQDFQGLNKLQNLFLSSNALRDLPSGIFNGLSSLQGLLLDHNSLQTLPPGVFIGLNALRNLWLNNNSLTRLPAGTFDDLLDTLGSTPGSTGLQLDSSLRAELAFASTASTGYEGTTVRVRATLSRALPVAVRVPFTIGGSATEDDYVGPSPAPDSGLMFLAGETSKEIAFTLSEDDDDQEESLVLTLAELVDIGLRRSDGTGTDAPFLNTERLLIRSAGNSEHTVTISDSELVEGFCDRTPQVRDKLLQITGVVVCTEMTVEQLAQVTGLDLRKSGITAFQAEDFRGLVSLQVLDLEKNKVGSLPEGIFSGLGSLQFLDLTNTKLRSLPVSVFSELGSLETLLLNVNSLRTLPLGVFSGLSNLQQLNLGSNRLSTLPDGIFSGLSSLQFLFLGGNRLGSLSEGIFSGLGNLVRLGLTGNSLSQLPESVFGGLNNLRYLHLSSNSLHSLPAGVFSGLSNLETLDLNGNPLSSLPVSVFNGLNSLESLQLAATSLNSLPAGIFDDVLDTLGLAPVLTGLLLNPHLMASLAFDSIAQTASEGTTVQVTATLSRELPVAVRVPYSLSGSATEDDYEGLSPAPQNGLLFLAGETSKGITFTLMENDDNQEETLVLTLGELSDIALRRSDGTGPDAPHLDGESLLVRPAEGSMQVVTIQDTEGGICDRTTQVRDKLLEITASPHCEEVTAEQLDQVTELKLSDSGISTLQPQDFQGLSKLQNLVLSSNALSDLPLGTFNGLSSMRNLLLDHNSLYTLPAGLFRGLSNVRNLWLNGNSLTRLPSGFFDDMLGTLGSTPGSAGLLLDSSLKASLAFASTAQTAGAGTTVEVKVRLSRALPVALRVPYHLGGSAGSDDYTHLSPSPSEGLLFRAGSTDTEIVLTLGDSAGIEGKTVVLTLGNLSDIGLRRSDGTGSDAPYLGSETLLERPETGSVHTITVARTDTGPVKAVFVPVILSLGGVNASFFTSEITLINRGSDQVALNYLYTAHAGGGSGRASEVIAPGRQKIVPDAFEHLNNLGIPVPRHGKRLGTLRVEVPVSSNVGVLVRTTTNVPDGRAGLAYLGIPEEEGFEEAVYLCGLRQNQQDRSNVAFQNMGAPEEGAITLRTTVYSGDVSDRRPRVLRDVRLAPGEFHQFNKVLGVLGSTANGYVKVERVEGTASFYAYGVINDQANSDGSFVFPIRAGSLERAAGQTLPVIVETSEFTSELTVTNFSEELRTLFFRFVAEGIRTDDMTTGFGITLNAGQQAIIADVVNELRRQGVAGLGSTRGFYAGPLFAEAEGGDMSGVVIGARTGSQGGSGQYSVFYTAVPAGEGFEETAWVYGLKQDEENRSNLALVNTGEVGDSESVFLIEIYDGETGLLAQTVVTRPIPAGHWHQFDGILGNYAPETRQGYVRILKVSGENPFLAYGVVNDGGAPGARSGDGAYVPAQE